MKNNKYVEFEIIEKAINRDPLALFEVIQHFSGLITVLSSRQVYNQNGNLVYVIDEELRDKVQERLIKKISKFKLSDTQ